MRSFARLGNLINVALLPCICQAVLVIRMRGRGVRNHAPIHGQLLPSPLPIVTPIEPPNQVHA